MQATSYVGSCSYTSKKELELDCGAPGSSRACAARDMRRPLTAAPSSLVGLRAREEDIARITTAHGATHAELAYLQKVEPKGDGRPPPPPCGTVARLGSS